VVGAAIGFAALALRKGVLAMIKAKGSKKHAANFAFLFIKASILLPFGRLALGSHLSAYPKFLKALRMLVYISILLVSGFYYTSRASASKYEQAFVTAMDMLNFSVF
jgi:hypothetical protein